jgi:thiamine-monophosphate kinase
MAPDIVLLDAEWPSRALLPGRVLVLSALGPVDSEALDRMGFRHVKRPIVVADGLLADLGHLCEASDLAAVIEAPRVPLSTAVRAVLATNSGHITTVLTGDDYEILFTAPPEAVDELAELSRTFEVPITAIGRMRSPSIGKQRQITVLDEFGDALIVDRSGWTHF